MEYLKNIEKVIQETNQVWTPPPNLKISDWADNYRRLSPESSAEAGAWRTDRAPYQREIMDAFNDPDIQRIIFMKSAQVGATETSRLDEAPCRPR